MSEFDLIAQDYQNTNFNRPLFQYAAYWSFFQNLGDLSNMNALDLACGEGLVTRELKKRGAIIVEGVDSSSEMIRLANAVEKKEKAGIMYRLDTVGELGKIGDFNLITAAFLLHYASSVQELEKMCEDCFINLSRGGTFLALNNNPIHPLSNDSKYGNLISCVNIPPNEGDKLNITHSVSDRNVKFTNYYWDKETYECSLKKVGFSEVEWLPVKVSEEGYIKFGNEYWVNFLKAPFFVIIKCKKLK